MAPVELTETFPLPHANDALRIDRLARIARLMDSVIRLPGTRIRIGLDAVFGLVPGLGDALTLMPSVYIIGSARQMGAPSPLLARMAGNAAIDAVLGTVPLIGDIFDAGFKSNLRNVELLQEHLNELQQKRPPGSGGQFSAISDPDQPTSSRPEKK